jgi:hypothetical protein
MSAAQSAAIRRGDFEGLVQEVFDPVPRSHGFTLTPQPPADWRDRGRAHAVYETTPRDFARRFPGVLAWTTTDGVDDIGCVDLWIEADLATNGIAVRLEGIALEELAARAGYRYTPSVGEAATLDESMRTTANDLLQVMARLSAM